MNDYLACKSVIDLVKDFGKQIIAEEREVDVVDDFVELTNRIQKLPKADYTEVKRGEWIDKCVRDWHCSLCDCEIQKIRKVDGYCYDDLPNYCPNCGAKMDGERNESEVQGK